MSDRFLEITITQDSPERLDKALAQLVPKEAALSRSRLQELIQSGGVFQGAKAVTDNKHKARAGETYRIELPAPTPSALEAENLPLDIVYEDADLAVINKPSGMVVHPSSSTPAGTLVNALLYHIGDSLSGIGGVERPGIVHRIDKDTSGLLVVAKNDRAHEGLGKQFRDHSIERLYAAFCYGELIAGGPRILGLQGVTREGKRALKVDLPIGRHKTDRLKMAVREGEQSRHAISHFRVLGHDEARVISKVECQLETGRTHQIRVHLSHLGFPLLGDPIYGKGARQLPKTAPDALRTDVENLHGQALHARVLGFIHPVTGEPMRFESPLPEDLQKLDAWIGA